MSFQASIDSKSTTGMQSREVRLSRQAVLRRSLYVSILAVFLISTLAVAQQSPEQYFGHTVGTDRKLVRHDKIISYLMHLAEKSERVHYEQVGESTLGEPLGLVVISTGENMAQVVRYREMARRLTDPRTLNSVEAGKLAEQGKAFVLFLCNQHSTEIASSNMAAELAWELATGKDPEMERALKDVFVMIVPSANPDGQQMIVDYYNKYLGTPHEGGPLPWLYHHYAGHDNNRDWFVLNLAENDALVKTMYWDWFPQVLVDVHQMGMTGARMFVPPFFDPPNPNNHHLIWNQIELTGSYMKYRLAGAGKSGVINNAYYSGWYQGSIRPNATQHHITALLTENASVRIASPVYVDPAELRGTDKGLPEYGVKMNFTDPWPGGWWRLRDIVEYQLVSLKAMVRVVADNRELFLDNFYSMAAESVALPENGAPYAYLVPPSQHDPGSTARMLKIFERTRCEIHRASSAFATSDGRHWPEGTLVLKVGQPYGRFVKDLLEQKLYPDIRKWPGGPPMPPYDNAAWTVSLMMGAEVHEIADPFEAELELLPGAPAILTSAEKSLSMLDTRDNNSFHAVNLLLARKVKVERLLRPFELEGESYPAGCFMVKAQIEVLTEVANDARVHFIPLEERPDVPRFTLQGGKIGVYRGWAPSADEGWTRRVLDEFEFDYERLTNEQVRDGKLIKDYAVIVLPSLSAAAMVDGRKGDDIPSKYRGGIGAEGVEELKRFVEQGGTLVALRSACRLVIDNFDVPVYEDLKGVSDNEFFCPGSLLKLEVDNKQPVGFGMPDATAAFVSGVVVLGTRTPSSGGPDRRVVARYGASDILLSGWIVGDDLIEGKPAVVEVNMGKGNIVLCGTGVQNRAQTWGTFKLLFNGLFSR
jgi:hypothetical protein